MDPKESNEQKLKEFADKIEGVTPPKATVTPIGTPIQDTGDVPKPWQRNPEQVQMINQIGWQKIPIKDLPTQGLFYPEGAEVNGCHGAKDRIGTWLRGRGCDVGQCNA